VPDTRSLGLTNRTSRVFPRKADVEQTSENDFFSIGRLKSRAERSQTLNKPDILERPGEVSEFQNTAIFALTIMLGARNKERTSRFPR
jgi:hypothetical protein